VQDGFDLYLHGFVVTNDGRWVVVQQSSPMVAHQISLSMGACIAFRGYARVELSLR
jgi:hypothetical protein